jgi:hypothetical protein
VLGHLGGTASTFQAIDWRFVSNRFGTRWTETIPPRDEHTSRFVGGSAMRHFGM